LTPRDRWLRHQIPYRENPLKISAIRDPSVRYRGRH
jgi:hypothetical protein